MKQYNEIYSGYGEINAHMTIAMKNIHMIQYPNITQNPLLVLVVLSTSFSIMNLMVMKMPLAAKPFSKNYIIKKRMTMKKKNTSLLAKAFQKASMEIDVTTFFPLTLSLFLYLKKRQGNG